MRHIIRRHTISLKHAYDGIVWSLRTQPNYRVHLLVSLMVVVAGVFFNVTKIEWVVLTLTIVMGLVVETINTAIESTTDAITYEWKEEIKIAKDASAAAMLTYAIGATVVATIIFGPRLL